MKANLLTKLSTNNNLTLTKPGQDNNHPLHLQTDVKSKLNNILKKYNQTNNNTARVHITTDVNELQSMINGIENMLVVQKNNSMLLVDNSGMQMYNNNNNKSNDLAHYIRDDEEKVYRYTDNHFNNYDYKLDGLTHNIGFHTIYKFENNNKENKYSKFKIEQDDDMYIYENKEINGVNNYVIQSLNNGIRDKESSVSTNMNKKQGFSPDKDKNKDKSSNNNTMTYSKNMMNSNPELMVKSYKKLANPQRKSLVDSAHFILFNRNESDPYFMKQLSKSILYIYI